MTIKCESIESLKLGKNFSILEYNGCGAEPHHAYSNSNTIWQAYGIFLHHWKILSEISIQPQAWVSSLEFQKRVEVFTKSKSKLSYFKSTRQRNGFPE